MKIADGLRRWSLLGSTRERGAAAERAAARHLKKLGYLILETNHRNIGGEIDLVARDADTLCFVEVKARARLDFGGAVTAVDRRKQDRLRRAAQMYLERHPHAGPCRFDIVALDRSHGEWRIDVYRDAF